MPNERPVEQPVRPGYWEHESGHVQEAWPDMPPDDVMRHKGWTPLYSQAALDAAVAAERERCAAVCDGVREAADHAARDGHRKAGAMSAAALCAKLIRA